MFCLLIILKIIGLLEYIYCDQVSLNEHTATELLKIVDKYCVPLLKELCEETLGNCLTVDNVVDLGILADKMEAKELLKVIVKFAKDNFDKVFEHNDIRKLPKSVLYDIYKQD